MGHMLSIGYSPLCSLRQVDERLKKECKKKSMINQHIKLKTQLRKPKKETKWTKFPFSHLGIFIFFNKVQIRILNSTARQTLKITTIVVIKHQIKLSLEFCFSWTKWQLPWWSLKCAQMSNYFGSAFTSSCKTKMYAQAGKYTRNMHAWKHTWEKSAALYVWQHFSYPSVGMCAHMCAWMMEGKVEGRGAGDELGLWAQRMNVPAAGRNHPGALMTTHFKPENPHSPNPTVKK